MIDIYALNLHTIFEFRLVITLAIFLMRSKAAEKSPCPLSGNTIKSPFHERPRM